MITVDEALAKVIENAGRQETVNVKALDALGLALAQDVLSDIDSPPFDKALMDGYAVRSEDMINGQAELAVAGEILAGTLADRSLGRGETYQIMTGAPIPDGADSVVIVERSNRSEDGRVRLDDPRFKIGQNIMPKGREMRNGERVLSKGSVIGPSEVGLLASVGRSLVDVYRRPAIAVLSTGDELVPVDQFPGPGKIRNSNESTIAALAVQAGCTVTQLGIAPDRHDVLSARIADGLKSDLLILSGGVSAGKKDLVPAALVENGVETVFHRVAMKPGKPVWFGKTRSGSLAFGLPGNPVSVFVCFELFVRTALRQRCGFADPRPMFYPARLARDVHYSSDRLTYHPAKSAVAGDDWEVEPADWFGSADLRALSRSVNCFVEFPISDQPLKKGRVMRILPIAR